MMRKVLYLKWDCFCEEYICDSLSRSGLQVDKYSIPYGKADMRYNEDFQLQLKECLNQNAYEFVFSFNYFPAVALACYDVQVRYVSWTYDSPFMYLYSDTIMLDTNLAFVFDKATVQELRQKGADTVFYLPMAAPVKYYDSLYSSSAIRKKYQAATAFVGSLYTEDRQNTMKYFEDADLSVKQYLDMLIEMQVQSYAMPVLERFLTTDMVRKLQQIVPIEMYEGEMQSEAWMYANYFLARESTARERTRLLSGVANRHRLKLYTPEPTPQYPLIENLGPVDYCKEMPYVFKNSNINLNIFLKSIYTGIPLRAFDIMGCGGFLLSDFQQDFSEFFIADEDYVFYTTIEDCVKKVDYYLEHDDVRNKIARNGYEKIKDAHTYDHRVRTILEML